MSWRNNFCVGAALTVLFCASTAFASLFPDLPVNRWVPVKHTCTGGLKHYFGGCPSERAWLQLAYDSKRGKVVLFGGSGEWYFNDLWRFDPRTQVWELVLQDTRLAGIEKDWNQYPQGRDNHQLIYDAEHDVYWMYGGTGGSGFWKFLPQQSKWVRMPGTHDGVSLPVAALDPGFAFAPALAKILLFGGERHSFWNQTWVFDTRAETWRKLATASAPAPRAQLENALVYDTPRQEFILFGGRDAREALLGDTWIFNLAQSAWRQIQTRPSPPARDGHIMVFDEKNKRVLLWGGTAQADTWLFDPAAGTWREVVAARGSYDASTARLASAVYLPDADLTVFRDRKGTMYFFRLDLSQAWDKPSDSRVGWRPRP